MFAFFRKKVFWVAATGLFSLARKFYRNRRKNSRPNDRTTTTSKEHLMTIATENGPAAETVTAFVGVNVVPMTGGEVLSDHTVLIRGDRIVAIAPTARLDIPASASVINGDGAFLMPGLADMHTHLDLRDIDPRHLVLYLATGTTTVRAMNGTPLNGRWRDQVNRGALLSPTILSADKTIIGGVDEEVLASLPMDVVPAFIPSGTEDVIAEVDRQVAGWADFVKVYDGLTEEQYLTAIKAAEEAGAYVAGHALDEASLETILTSGINEIAHIDEMNSFHWVGFPGEPGFALKYEAISETAALFKDNDVAIVSNLVADEVMYELIFDSEGVLSRPEYHTVRPHLIDYWRTKGRQVGQFAEQGPYRRDLEMPFFKALLLGLQRAGVTITIGTDASHLEGSLQSQIHRDLELLVESGLSRYEALAAGTTNAAAVVDKMGRDSSFGTVATGQRADLLLLRANPLQDVTATQDRIGVMAQGRWYLQHELDSMVRDFVATY